MDQTTKQVERLAVVLIIATVLTTVSSPITQMITMRMLSVSEVRSMTLEAHAMRWVQVMIAWLVNVALGVWLFLTAKRSGRAKWIWALFALTSGLGAVILYFILDLLDQLKRQNDSEPTGPGDGNTCA